MRKIYSQSINSPQNQHAIDQIAKSVGSAQSRILERILEAISPDDLITLIQGKINLSESSTIHLDNLTVEAIRQEIAHGISSLAARTFNAAHEGARIGLIEACTSLSAGEQP